MTLWVKVSSQQFVTRSCLYLNPNLSHFQEKKQRPNAGSNSKNPHDAIDCTPPDYILPSSTDRPQLPLHPNFAREMSNKLQCLKVKLKLWKAPRSPLNQLRINQHYSGDPDYRFYNVFVQNGAPFVLTHSFKKLTSSVFKHRQIFFLQLAIRDCL